MPKKINLLFLRWLVFSNLVVSISAGALAFGCALLLNTKVPAITYSLFVFGATLFTYNFQRLIKVSFEKNKKVSPRNFWISTHQIQLKLLSFLGLILTSVLYFTYLFKWKTLLLLIPLGIISVLYAIRFMQNKNLREIPYLKIHLIALVWSSACVLLPSLNTKMDLKYILSLNVSVYLYILAITIPFDIRDLIFDKQSQKTIPQVHGVERAKYIASTLLMASLVLILSSVTFELLTLILLIFAYCVQLILILRTNENRKELYFSGYIDGCIVLLALALIF